MDRHLAPLLQPGSLLLLLPRRRAVVERDLRRLRLPPASAQSVLLDSNRRSTPATALQCGRLFTNSHIGFHLYQHCMPSAAASRSIISL